MSDEKRQGSRLTVYSKVLHRIEYGMVAFSGVFIVMLMFLTDTNVFGRYLLNKPLAGSVEISIIVLAILMMTSQPWVQATDGHLRLEFIMEHLPPRAVHYLRIAVLVVILALCILLAWQSASFTIRSWADRFWGLLVIPQWPAMIAVPISIGIVCLRVPLQIFEEIAKLRQPAAGRGK